MFRTIILIILIFSTGDYAQFRKTQRDHAFSRTMVLTVEGGVTRGFTDYKDPILDLSGRGMLEYFFPTSSPSVFGIRILGGAGYIKGKDDSKNPPRFRTDLIYGGGGLVYSLSIGDAVFPYVFAGGTYLYYNPKGTDNEPLPNNLKGVYKKHTVDVNGEFGLRVLLARDLSINVSGTAFLGTEDYLDDIVFEDNDVIFTANAGLSFSFFGRTDADGDGIYDSDDECPDEPEDFDKFEDRDGCPDVDDDEDGIIDRLDKCKNQKEDFDGFQDEDGCPDIDNDSDGIVDSDDKCANQVEDFDGFQDNDGCPDNDNDGDGILDKSDGCPGEAETRNGFEDEDGCPDEKPKPAAPKEMILKAGANFAVGKSELNPVAFNELDKIVAVIKETPNSRWRIEGHTDNTGSAEKNKKLSYERARAVLDYFIGKGLERNRFEVFGLGEDIPVADNGTEEGRTRNRRVAILRVD